VVGQQNADIANSLQPRDVAMATIFWLLMGYIFGCIIASNTLFHSRGEFLGSSYSVKTGDSEVLRDVAMATTFGSKIAITRFE